MKTVQFGIVSNDDVRIQTVKVQSSLDFQGVKEVLEEHIEMMYEEHSIAKDENLYYCYLPSNKMQMYHEDSFDTLSKFEQGSMFLAVHKFESSHQVRLFVSPISMANLICIIVDEDATGQEVYDTFHKQASLIFLPTEYELRMFPTRDEKGYYLLVRDANDQLKVTDALRDCNFKNDDRLTVLVKRRGRTIVKTYQR